MIGSFDSGEFNNSNKFEVGDRVFCFWVAKLGSLVVCSFGRAKENSRRERDRETERQRERKKRSRNECRRQTDQSNGLLSKLSKH